MSMHQILRELNLAAQYESVFEDKDITVDTFQIAMDRSSAFSNDTKQFIMNDCGLSLGNFLKICNKITKLGNGKLPQPVHQVQKHPMQQEREASYLGSANKMQQGVSSYI